MIFIMDELEEFLNKASGKLTIEVDGMTPHIKGDVNKAGALMAAFAVMKFMEMLCKNDMESAFDTIRQLDEVMNYEIKDRNEVKK